MHLKEWNNYSKDPKKNSDLEEKLDSYINDVPDYQTQQDLDALKLEKVLERTNELFDIAMNKEITSEYFDQYKTYLIELFSFLNDHPDFTNSIDISIDEFKKVISIINYKFHTILIIKFLLKQLTPEYKWNNILELTKWDIFYEEYYSMLYERFDLKCTDQWKNITEELEKTKVIEEPDENELQTLIKTFEENYLNIKKDSSN